MNFWVIFMGFWWGEYEEHDRNLKIDFWTSFLWKVILSKLFLVDLERLARFLDEPRVDLDSLDDFEWNGMVEIVG